MSCPSNNKRELLGGGGGREGRIHRGGGQIGKSCETDECIDWEKNELIDWITDTRQTLDKKPILFELSNWLWCDGVVLAWTHAWTSEQIDCRPRTRYCVHRNTDYDLHGYTS